MSPKPSARIFFDRRGVTRAHDRRGRPVKVSEARRRLKIASYARRRARDEGGHFTKRELIVSSRYRPVGQKTRKGSPPRDVFIMETDLADIEPREIREALDKLYPEDVHFGLDSVLDSGSGEYLDLGGEP